MGSHVVWFGFFMTEFPLWSLDCPETCCVDQVGLELTETLLWRGGLTHSAPQPSMNQFYVQFTAVHRRANQCLVTDLGVISLLGQDTANAVPGFSIKMYPWQTVGKNTLEPL